MFDYGEQLHNLKAFPSLGLCLMGPVQWPKGGVLCVCRGEGCLYMCLSVFIRRFKLTQ